MLGGLIENHLRLPKLYSVLKKTELNEEFFASPRLAKHATFFIQMIEWAIGLLGPAGCLDWIGKKYAGFRVTASHYPAAKGDAPLKTIEEVLGDKFSWDVIEAWVEVQAAVKWGRKLRSLFSFSMLPIFTFR
jgi:hemoglobin-like flavoprotein